jgi:hypothetical protein
MDTAIMYGNSNTGALFVLFGTYLATYDPSANFYLLGSSNFTRIYNQCIRFVNGE